ncbi:MAG: MBL fold metallo-hydrolase [Flavobacteriales bacterium]|nr:MBL fold metallo-hydrolase [Flavobacteriales bacterium]MBK7942545.1 MBL fold metallo-hydrolase [Flavobacteriales bacterium]MBK9699055.1 MBL fold metallo-hydrolase [Flavobacteriales bacterium]
MRSPLLAIVLLLIAALPLRVSAQRVNATFIGNCAFRIGLEDWTLFADFPYQPGYSGYDTYELPADIASVRGTALITHGHLDHFDSSRFAGTRLDLIAPFQAEDAQASAISRLEAQGIYIYPQATPHADMPHASYIVSIRGRRLYIAGDTEDPAHLLASRDLAVAFVTPWLLRTVQAQGKRIDARAVVVMHHEAATVEGLDLPAPCDGCRFIIPRQGEVIELFR